MARQHRRQIGALAYRAHSSCTPRQALPSGARLACCAASKGAIAPASFESTAFEPGPPASVRPIARSRGPENLYGASTPAPDPSRGVLTMLFMYSTAGLGSWRAIDVLCRFWAARSRPLPSSSPARCRAAANRGCGHRKRPRAESRQPPSTRTPKRHRFPPQKPRTRPKRIYPDRVLVHWTVLIPTPGGPHGASLARHHGD